MNAVPRIVHQVWLGPEIPEAEYLMREAGRLAVAAGWAYARWNSVRPQERARNVSAQSNLVRWRVLDEVGGLYLDADVILRALPDILEGAWISGVRKPGLVNPAIQAQPAGHSYSRRILDFVAANLYPFDRERFTGPWAATACMGSDVSVWPWQDWGPDGRYGTHLFRGSSGWNSLSLPAVRS